MADTPKCHFCGGDTVLFRSVRFLCVFCESCQACGPNTATTNEAIAAYLDFSPSWRPMETAPKDGTVILINWDVDEPTGKPMLAFWGAELGGWAHPSMPTTPVPRDPLGWLPLPKD